MTRQKLKAVMSKKGEGQEEDLETTQKIIEEVARKVAHTTKADRDQTAKQTPEIVIVREEASARCTKVIGRRVLKKQSRKANADHLIRGCKMPGRHCEGVCTDLDETREVQEDRLEYFNEKGNQYFTDDGRRAEITIDLVLQARAKMSDNNVNVAEDAVVSETIKQVTQGKTYIIMKCFQERFMGLTEAPSSWKIVKWVFLRIPDAEPKQVIRCCKALH